ncbi:tetratricopeptide repeat protein [Bradyrhizobium sp. JYMT SZCCT0180]|uniref:tetratricopeptide repeat protein n=1 Tax=Bradyrhizobium sp. JYMT SZCCT0180 TaxID=2807666 RepID=UPI001BABA16B|nr:tetratricopeptide repeat protein [Bradyrhizobium sp. JYMT SZCCT0180]MBR1211150.1 tetratricopeptide repeat protein [Bradyrhizobium sp. JYMT SZCCT0180]
MFRRGGIALWVLVVQLASGPSLAADQCSLELLQANAARAAEACTSVLNADETTTASRVAALKIRGRAMQRLDRYPDAIADYETGLRIAPDDAELHLRRGWTAYDELLRGGGSYFDPGLQPALDLALKQATQALKLKPGYPDAYFLTGAALTMAGPDRFAEAKAAHDEAIRLDPNNPAMWFGRLIMLEKNRRFHEAIEDADVILRLPADLITKPRAAESYLKSTTHRIATAIKRAEMLRKLGRTNEAWQAYNMAAELDPDPITYSRRAEFRLSQIGFFPGMPPPPLDAVQADLDKALALDPDYWVSHEQRGHLLVIREQYDAAATEFALALKQYPENGGMRWSYAMALRKLGRSEEAAGEGITAFRMDRGFMFQKLGMLRRLGYLAAIAPDADPRPAIMDAARACMLDERCG